MLEHIVGHTVALPNPLGGIERPVNTEVNAALRILLLCLRQRGESPLDQRPNISRIVTRYTVEFIRDKGKRNPIGSIEIPQHLEERASKAGMPRRIGRKRRGKVRSHKITGRCTERQIGDISYRRGIAVAELGEACLFIGFANASYRPPVLIMVLGLP